MRYVLFVSLLIGCILPQSLWAGGIRMEWLDSDQPGNLFIREKKPIMRLKVTNLTDQQIDSIPIAIKQFDQYQQQELPLIKMKVQGPLAVNQSQTVTVDLAINQAGVYDVTAWYAENQAKMQVSWIRGPQPPEVKTNVPFFATVSHAKPTEWDYKMRREFGSRFERERIVWQDAVDHETGEITRGPVEQDEIVQIVRANGGMVSGSFASTPPYASMERAKGNETKLNNYPVMDKYVDWVQRIVAHYKDVIQYWEVHNEPNIDGGFIQGSAEQVADLHKASALAAKRVWPQVNIIGATTVGVDTEYMDRLKDAGAVDYMDIIAFHPYRWDYPQDPGTVNDLNNIIQWRDRHAPGRALWDDEWGPWVNQEEVPHRYADMVARHLVIAKGMGIEQVSVYTWDGHYLRMWFDDKPTPSAIAYRTAAQRLTNAKPVAVLSEGKEGLYGYVFDRDGQMTLVTWITDEQGSQKVANIPVTEQAQLYDAMGNPHELSSHDGTVILQATRRPVYLVGVHPSFVESLKPVRQPTHQAPPIMHSGLWYGFKYPDGSEVFSLPLGTERKITLTVRNDGDQPVNGTIYANSQNLQVLDRKIRIQMQPGESRPVTIRVKADADMSPGSYRVNISSKADHLSFGRMRIRCEVAKGDVKYFHMSTWEMAQNIVDRKEFGGSIHIHWVNPGGFMVFKFDLTDKTNAKLESLIDSVSPAPGDGGQFRICASSNQKDWKVLLEGRGPMKWRDVDLSDYADKVVFVRFENSSDKGQARIKAMRLTTSPAN